MKREPIDSWEDKFIAICRQQLDEEPLYPYEHLWQKGLSPQSAFEKFLEENEDLAEKYSELSLNNALPASKNEEIKPALTKLERQLEQQKDAEAKIAAFESRFCPECGRRLNSRGVCKCGYKKKRRARTL